MFYFVKNQTIKFGISISTDFTTTVLQLVGRKEKLTFVFVLYGIINSKHNIGPISN